MKTLYAVPWIEVEYGWGDRPEGFKVFDNLDECLESSKTSSENGNYDGGYMGPERPMYYYETPDEIEGPYPCWVKSLKFKSEGKPII